MLKGRGSDLANVGRLFLKTRLQRVSSFVSACHCLGSASATVGGAGPIAPIGGCSPYLTSGPSHDMSETPLRGPPL